MKNDLELTFGEIFHNDFAAFQKQLLKIQAFRRGREQSEEWVQILRFLDVSPVPDLEKLDEEPPSRRMRIIHGVAWDTNDNVRGVRSMPSNSISLVEKHLGHEPYIAVSWKWPCGKNAPPPYGCESCPSFDYKVQRPGEEPYKSEFPDYYLERVIRFAQEVDITNIWIDKESIYQVRLVSLR